MPDTIDHLVRSQAARRGAKPMVIDQASRLSYLELDSSTSDLAAVFIQAGVGKGTRVGLIMPNGVRWVQIAIALTRIGAVLVPLSTLLRPRELASQLRSAAVQFLISVPEFRGHRYLDAVESVPKAELPALQRVWADDQVSSSNAGARALRMVEPIAETVTAADTLVIMFTSGSTGAPKGVLHSHGSALGAVRSGLTARRITSATRLYLPMPFFWVGGFGGGILSALLAGATLVTEARPFPENTLRLLEAERVTMFRGWPDQAEALARHPSSVDVDLSALQPGSLQALLPPERRAQPGARARLFGMTEAFGPYCGYPADTDMPTTAWGSCGKPFPGMEIRIVDPETGTRVPAETIGQIQIRGRTRYAASAGAAAKRSSPLMATTAAAISVTSTRTATCSITAGPTTCSRSAVPLSTPWRSKPPCGQSTASPTPSSPTWLAPRDNGWLQRWCAAPRHSPPRTSERRRARC